MKDAALLRRPKPDHVTGMKEVLSMVNRYIDDTFNGFGDDEKMTDDQMLEMAKECFTGTVMVSNPINLDCEAALAACRFCLLAYINSNRLLFSQAFRFSMSVRCCKISAFIMRLLR